MFYDIFFDAVKNSLKSYKTIHLKYSYYEHDEFDNDVENIKSLFSVENSSLWTKKSFLAPFSPNLDKVMKIAAKINADLIMLYYIHVAGESGISSNYLYLIDTNKKVIIEKKYHDKVFNSKPFESTMKNILNDYFRNKEAS